MSDIKDSVGDGGVNRRCDVALIQVLLKAAKNSKGHSYYNDGYTGAYGADLKRAISTFQTDQKLLAKRANSFAARTYWPFAPPSAPNLNPFKTYEKPGFIGPKGPTMTKLVATLPVSYKNINILEDVGLVYWETTAATAEASATSVEGDGGLEPGFRANIAKLVRQVFSAHKLSLRVAPRTGGLRTFEQQYKLATTKTAKGTFATGAGPGESNHNFGFAVDIGFAPFKWLSPTGAVVTDDLSLETLQHKFDAKFVAMWHLRNKYATPLGLYKTHFKNDLGHLQNFDDSHVSMGRSLAALMTRVGKHKWQYGGGTFKTDLGLGGNFYPVGKSEQIWEGKALVTAKVLAEALKAAKKADNVKEADVKAMQLGLKADLQAAEANRFQWGPVP
jgi:hypothetical protein